MNNEEKLICTRCETEIEGVEYDMPLPLGESQPICDICYSDLFESWNEQTN